ncbi:hypothetical protein ERJ75_000547200 [Trypanosoma vivax]|nr:hypothetical protein ERJ75_001377500 [Trypanosoma vivax]KAH8615806.1 hypothetical protein ERJ75_000547200 [Trypanosoma vivax]
MRNGRRGLLPVVVTGLVPAPRSLSALCCYPAVQAGVCFVGWRVGSQARALRVALVPRQPPYAVVCFTREGVRARRAAVPAVVPRTCCQDSAFLRGQACVVPRVARHKAVQPGVDGATALLSTHCPGRVPSNGRARGPEQRSPVTPHGTASSLRGRARAHSPPRPPVVPCSAFFPAHGPMRRVILSAGAVDRHEASRTREHEPQGVFAMRRAGCEAARPAASVSLAQNAAGETALRRDGALSAGNESACAELPAFGRRTAQQRRLWRWRAADE